MINILILAQSHRSLQRLQMALEADERINVYRENGEDEALERIERDKIDLVIADEKSGTTTGLIFARRLVSYYPMVNMALVSSLDKEAFHEASEGLGILMSLPKDPGEKSARALLERLKTIYSLSTS
jgi:DNA-binding NarL/FixJ family response regulator